MDDPSPTRRVLRWQAAAAALLALAAPAGCTRSTATTAASFLRNVREEPDPNIRYAAYSKLASPNVYDDDAQKAEAVRTLIAKLDQGKEPIATRAVICRTLGELRDPAARDVLLKAVNDNEAVVRSQACRALGKVARPEDATILARVMTVDTLEDCRIAAIEGLGEMRVREPRIMEVLVNGMEHDDPAIRLASLEALRQITGQDLGVEPGPWRKFFHPEVAAAKAAAPRPR